MLADFDQQAVLARAVHAVAVGFEAVLAKAPLHGGGVEQGAERIVPAQAVGGEAGHRAAHVAHEHVAAAVVGGVLRLERVGHVVALERVVCGVEHHAHVGIGAKADEAQGRAALEAPRPVATSWYAFGPQDAVGAHTGQRISGQALPVSDGVNRGRGGWVVAGVFGVVG